ncbi:DivIVA domain-containing protein [Oscillospiraceae bacterium LCP25S3_E10]|nr:DivIVA domain-containing protein [Ruminococcus sp.]MDD6447532.1 DivIVA domain-containing protein [Ruminococcus sp.]MDY2856598.1 DivIVA domain-containing protein [Oscillospiraceae bacterium]
MISIEDAKNVEFKKSVRGYNAEDVDNFVDEVVATLEQNKKEKVELVKKLDILAKRIEQYRQDEENVRGALINAEKVKGSAVKEAESKVSNMLEEAKAEAKRIVYDANASIVEQKNNYLKLQADAVVLREQLLATYNNHIRMLEDLPTSADIGQKKIELDQQYPTDPVPNFTEDEAKPLATAVETAEVDISNVVEQATQQNAESEDTAEAAAEK